MFSRQFELLVRVDVVLILHTINGGYELLPYMVIIYIAVIGLILLYITRLVFELAYA